MTKFGNNFLEPLLLPVHLSSSKPTHTHKFKRWEKGSGWVLRDILYYDWHCCGNCALLWSPWLPTWSILLTATASCVTPSDRTRRACSLVCPPASNPASNSPRLASTTRMATSAYKHTDTQIQNQNTHTQHIQKFKQTQFVFHFKKNNNLTLLVALKRLHTTACKMVLYTHSPNQPERLP